MRRRALQLVWPPSGMRGFGVITNRYNPPLTLVKNSYPEPGKFFRPKDHNDINVATIALRTYGQGNTANGVVAIANSTWNRAHIYYAKTGYGPYAEHLIDGTGPQQERRYGTDPLSEPGSGSHWPTYWLPPLEGRPEPEEYFGWDPPAEPVEPGTGPAGPPGPQGPGPTPEQISAAVSQYLAANPPPPGPIGPPGAVGAAGGPGPRGEPGPPGRNPTEAEIQAAVTQYFVAHPPPVGTVSDEAIHAAVQTYLQANPPSQGPAGPRGEPGPIGPPGRSPTEDEIAQAVAQYIQANPPPSGTVSQQDIANAVAAYLEANPPSGGAVSQADIAAAVAAYLEANPPPPPPPISPAELNAAIEAYMQAHPLQPVGGAGGSQLPTIASFACMAMAMKQGIY